MRLIDADKLYLPPEDIGSRMAVACAPTAYDVDKVVEELKNKQNHHKALTEYERQVGTIVEMKEHEYAIQVLSEAIDIVKRGGIE